MGSGRAMQMCVEKVFARGIDADEVRVRNISPAGLDEWQLAAVAPLLRRRELLVIAPTGSGKSFVSACAVSLFLANIEEEGRLLPGALDVRSVIVAVRDPLQRRDQFEKICGSKVFRRALRTAAPTSGGGLGNNYVNVGDPSSSKPIRILSFAQAGNALRRGGEVLDPSTLLIIDEVHELANPKEANPQWAESIEFMNEILDARAKLPYAKRFVLLGMTATPPTDQPDQMERLLSWFEPVGLEKPFRAAEMSARGGPAPPFPFNDKDAKACSMKADAASAAIAYDRLLGYSLFVYNVDRNITRFARWSTREPFVLLVNVQEERKQKGGDITIDARRGSWSPGELRHSNRARKLAAAYAEGLVQLFKADVRKTLVFLHGNAAVDEFGSSVRCLWKDADVLHSDQASQTEQMELKRRFDAGGTNIVLVANVKAYGTGHTFQSNDPAEQVGKGARRIVYTPLSSAGKMMQAEGRAIRRGTHSAIKPEFRDVDRVIVIPVGLPAKEPVRGKGGKGGKGKGGKAKPTHPRIKLAMEQEEIYDPLSGKFVKTDSSIGRDVLRDMEMEIEYLTALGIDNYLDDDDEELKNYAKTRRQRIEFKQKYPVLSATDSFFRFFAPSKRADAMPLSKFQASVKEIEENSDQKKAGERLRAEGLLSPREQGVSFAIQSAGRTSEGVALMQNLIGRWASDSILDAMFLASAGARALWNWRPLTLESFNTKKK